LGDEIYDLRRKANFFASEKSQREEKTRRLSIRISSLEAEAQEFAQKIKTDTAEKERLSSGSVVLEKKISEIVREIEKIEKEVEGFAQDLDQSQIEVFQIELEQVIEEFSEIQKKQEGDKVNAFFGRLHGIFEKARRLIKGLNQKDRAVFDQKLRQLRQAERELESTISKGKIEIERLESKILYGQQKTEQIQREIFDVKEEVKKLETQNDDVLDENQLAKKESEINEITTRIEKINTEISEKSKDSNERKQKILSQINSYHQQEASIRHGLYEIELLVGKKTNTIENQQKEITQSKNRIDEIDTRLSENSMISVDTNPEIEKELEKKRVDLTEKD
jgi:chromosome segregation ATPase